MRLLRIILIVAVGLGLVPSTAFPDETPLLDTLGAEIERTMKALTNEEVPAYFLGYEITESHRIRLSTSFGALISKSETRGRQLDVDLRVGGYQLDNTHKIRSESFDRFDFERYVRIPMPLVDDPEAIRDLLWHYTDERYRRAKEKLTRVKTNVQVKVAAEDLSADFSREEKAERFVGEEVELDLDVEAWEKRLRSYTAPFAPYGEIYRARSFLTAETNTRWFASSEGARILVSQPRYRLVVSALTKAEDGMELPRYESFFATSADKLPDDDTVLAAVDGMISDLLELREAPVVDPYTGPAILSGRASGVFFHEIFGHRVEGHRQKDEYEGQTFKKKIGEKVLPETFSVHFDPTLKSHDGHELAGHYLYDNQGIRARRVTVLKDGVFERFLMSRSPIEGFDRSNGHGRRQPGFKPVARQSSLIVEVRSPMTSEELKERLLELVRAEEKPYGLLFEDIQGGFTITGRTIPNAFNVLPIKVFRVYPDGREELVRGVDLIGTPLVAFSKIVAADTSIDVFNGTCGAESGGVPVSAASPGILVSQIEVQKKQKSQERPPILPAPPVVEVEKPRG